MCKATFTIAAMLIALAVRAQTLNTVGVTLLRSVATNVDGTGIRVAQPEGSYNLGTNWEVNPNTINRPIGFITFTSANGSTTNFPNSLSSESSHADTVAGFFYGVAGGVATNVAHVDNYDASYFYNSIINALSPVNIQDSVVNQSFNFSSTTVSQQQQIDSAYDNYSVQFTTLFVSGAGNGGPVNPPATCYNGIGVGVSDGSSSYGPTLDNGRAKPDITAPGEGVTSFSTPLVAGAAAALLQAALRGDGGSDTNSAADLRTVKALLLNGAVKPIGWTNATFSPLDAGYGAGMLNVFNAYEQLTFGKHAYIVATSVGVGGPHPPNGATGTVTALSGWDFDTVSSTSAGPNSADGVNHYYFNATNGTVACTATLVWNRPQSISSTIHASINNLNLFLYNTANSNLVMCSTSLVDNVEHLFLPQLAPGRYDLQVWKAGGSGIVSSSENYALAWEFAAPKLNLGKSGPNAVLRWPVYPAGYEGQATTNLLSAWSANNLPGPSVANGSNTVTVPMTNGAQFFRLRQPNF